MSGANKDSGSTNTVDDEDEPKCSVDGCTEPKAVAHRSLCVGHLRNPPTHASPDEIMAEVQKRSLVHRVCTAYESGMGRGMSGRDLSQPYEPTCHEGIAYETGWYQGRSKQPDEPAPSQAAQDVLAERQRQISKEGWDAKHDDFNASMSPGVLIRAARCYALNAMNPAGKTSSPPSGWPFDAEGWKPKSPRRDLVRAAALLLAEIDRLDRLGLTKVGCATCGELPPAHKAWCPK